MTLRLIPCFENIPHEGKLSPFRPVHGGMTDEALSVFVEELYEYGKDEDFTGDTLESKVEILGNREDIILGGHLAAVKDDFVLLPGCCVGLEAWREWELVKPGGDSPWLGYDPFPGAEITEADVVLWTDAISSGGKSLKVSFEDVSSALQVAENDLKGFHKRLSEWFKEQNVGHRERFLNKLDRKFEINMRRDTDDKIFAIISGSGAE